MPTEGLCLRLTHTGVGNQVFLNDIHDAVDALNMAVNAAKPGTMYLSPGQVVELIYTSSVAQSFEAGSIRTWVSQGVLLAEFVIGTTLDAAFTGATLPPLPGVVGAVLAEGPVGTITFRQLVQSEILPDWAILSFAAGAPLIEVSDSTVTPSFTASYVDAGRVATAVLTNDSDAENKNVAGTPTAFTSDNTFTETTLNATVTFTLTTTDSLTGAGDVDTAAITWAPRTFWGTDVDGLSTEADVEGLANSALDTNRNRTFTVTAGAGDHIYYGYPDAYGAATFTVGGFAGGFILVSSTISVTNPFGFTTDYRLYKSVAAGLGATTVVVS